MLYAKLPDDPLDQQLLNYYRQLKLKVYEVELYYNDVGKMKLDDLFDRHQFVELHKLEKMLMFSELSEEGRNKIDKARQDMITNDFGILPDKNAKFEYLRRRLNLEDSPVKEEPIKKEG